MKKPVKIIVAVLVFCLVSLGCFIGIANESGMLDEFKLAAVSSLAGDIFSDEDKIIKEFTVRDEEGKEEEEEQEEETVSRGTTVNAPEVEARGSVSRIVENVMPAIVSINCMAYYDESDFFGRQYSARGSGAGSGIIIGQDSKEILIVTNAHVVNGTDPSVSVVFCDEEEYDAEIKGLDSESDLAVVSVKMDELSKSTINSIKIASLGSSDDTKVGEMAIAIGNALGYGQSVTVGYVSAKERQIDIEDSSHTMRLIQTDAAINPGNSGGALINTRGEIIGINSAKFSSTEVEGMGYAIPIGDALPIITALMNNEEVEHKKAYLGIVGTDISSQDSVAYHMPKGIYIREVSEGSPAQKAGLMPGQIILKCNDKDITMSGLESLLDYAKTGDIVTLTVTQLNMGSYEEKNINVTLGEKVSD